MRLTFHVLRCRNLLSTGNQFIEISLDTHQSTLIYGHNGSGKSSTLIDSLHFALYGTPFRKINKNALLNSINQKNLEVELEFSIGGDRYKIIRGIKPNKFELIKNGETVNKESTVAEQQKYLETHILKMSSKSFGQIVVLGSATYQPFMQLKTAERREVIEDLLDIQVFSQMNAVIKKRVSDTRDEIADIDRDIDIVEAQIKSAKELNERVTNMHKVQVDGVKAKMARELEAMQKVSDQMGELKRERLAKLATIEDAAKVSERLRKLENIRRDLNHRLQKEEQQTGFYEKDECPTCKQAIDAAFREGIMAEFANTKEQILEAVKACDEKIAVAEERQKEIDAVNAEVSEITNSINDRTTRQRLIRDGLVSLKEELESAQQELSGVDESEITKLQEEHDQLTKKYNDATVHRERLAKVTSMLKDTGIKANIIANYIPIMNSLINEYLSAFDLFVDFQLDENFDETIKSRHRDNFTYMSFSEGEKSKIDVSLMLTWREISKVRNSVTTNLLVMDEIMDSSADVSGKTALLDLISRMEGDNVIVISHNEAYQESFDRLLKFQKIQNFTVVEEESHG